MWEISKHFDFSNFYSSLKRRKLLSQHSMKIFFKNGFCHRLWRRVLLYFACYLEVQMAVEYYGDSKSLSELKTFLTFMITLQFQTQH